MTVVKSNDVQMLNVKGTVDDCSGSLGAFQCGKWDFVTDLAASKRNRKIISNNSCPSQKDMLPVSVRGTREVYHALREEMK